MGEIPRRSKKNFSVGMTRFPIAAIALHGMGKIPYRGYRLARNGRDSASRLSPCTEWERSRIAAIALHKIIPHKENKKIMHFIFVFFKKTLLFVGAYALNTNCP